MVQLQITEMVERLMRLSAAQLADANTHAGLDADVAHVAALTAGRAGYLAGLFGLAGVDQVEGPECKAAWSAGYVHGELDSQD